MPGTDAQRRMKNEGRAFQYPAPPGAKQSAVLIVLFPKDGGIHTVLIERSADGGVHGGQIAWPGGKRDPIDKDLVQTAIREAKEEIDLAPAQVTVLGQLTPLYIPVSNFNVSPIVGFCEHMPPLVPAEREVANILLPSLPDIFNHKTEVEVQGTYPLVYHMRAKAYRIPGHPPIWGATAMILSELEAIWSEWPGSSPRAIL